MDKTKKRMSAFWKFYIIYVLVFAAVIAGGLMFFYKYMAAYEEAGSQAFLRHYMSELKQGAVSEELEKQLDVLDENIKSREESLAFVKELLADSGYARIPGEKGEGYETVAVYSNGNQIGKIKTQFSGETRMGFELWELAEESWDLSAFIQSESCYLPENYTFKVGNADYSAGKDKIEYEVLDYVYPRYENVPYMHKFESGMYIGDAEVKYYDHNGKEVNSDQLNEQFFLNNCDKALHDRLAEFGELFINRYVDFGAVNGGYFFGNYGLLKELMQPDSEIWNRITESWGIIFYGNTEYCKILDLDVNICSKLADNLYLIDVSYDTETKAWADPVWDDNFARIVAVENEEGDLVTVSMYNY